VSATGEGLSRESKWRMFSPLGRVLFLPSIKYSSRRLISHIETRIFTLDICIRVLLAYATKMYDLKVVGPCFQFEPCSFPREG
jgi:hypothetical protein